MLRTFKYAVLVLLLSVSSISHAQITQRNDTAKKTQTAQQIDSARNATPLKVDYITDPLNDTRFHSIDTSLNGWQLTKPVFAYGLGKTFTSDSYTASRDLIFKTAYFASPALLTDPFYIYQFHPQSLMFYHGTRRYTEFSYSHGPEKDQHVQITYSQLLAKRLFVGIDYRRDASLGYYNRHTTGSSNLDLWISYYTKNSRYRIFADGIWNKNSSDENGGIKNYNPDQQPNTLPVNLNLSENSCKTRYFNVIQFWSPSFLSKTSSDSSGKHFNSYSNILPARLFLSSELKRNSYTYSDQSLGDGFYQHFYLNANSTQDSIVCDNFSNKFGIQVDVGKSADSTHHSSHFEASINHDLFSLKQGDQSFEFPAVLHEYTNLSVSASLANDSKLFWQLNSTYFFYGRNKDDYSAFGKLGYHLNKILAVDVHGSADLAKPSLLENNYYSNNFIWQNDFLKKEIKKTGATISSAKYKFSVTADYFIMNNFIYFDTAALPAQIDQQKFMSLQANDRISWKHWNLLLKIVYQKTTGNDVLRLPDWQTYSSLYYENNFFKSALFAQVGVDVRYVSAYYGNAYMPATRIFYLQDSVRVGGYRTADVFINMRIKAARLFLKFENVASFIESGVKYYAPGYPLAPFTIRWGISFRFFD